MVKFINQQKLNQISQVDSKYLFLNLNLNLFIEFFF